MSSRPRKVLVVDDVEANRDLLARRLVRRGYEVAVAEDGATALRIVEQGDIDLVLLDIRMPGMSGLDALEKIRETHSKTELPVLMVTAETDSSEVVRALNLGANDYVTKPIDFPVVLARVAGAISIKAEVDDRRATVVTSTDVLAPGFVLDGRYRIESVAGEGGFAFVYKATQMSTGQTVALKLMRVDRLISRAQAETERARFRREMKLIGEINHPNIVRLIDSGELRLEGTEPAVESSEPVTRIVSEGAAAAETETMPATKTLPYLVMEHLAGETLSAVLKRDGRIGIEQSVDLLVPITSAVGTAHQHSVIHRDLKPANIFLIRNEDGALSPRVLDFGIAKLLGDDVKELTVTASVIGTPDYMAPEQARGEKTLTPRADQYTLAVVLYHCLTGRRPYISETFISLIHMVADGDFSPPSLHNPDIPMGLERVIVKAMSSQPDNRYESIREFGRALLPYASEPIRAHWNGIL